MTFIVNMQGGFFEKNYWKKGIIINNYFQQILDEFNCKPNKIWVNKWSEFYNKSMKLWLQDNVIQMYSAYNEGKPIPAETFIITLKDKIFKLMTSVSKMCI